MHARVVPALSMGGGARAQLQKRRSAGVKTVKALIFLDIPM